MVATGGERESVARAEEEPAILEPYLELTGEDEDELDLGGEGVELLSASSARFDLAENRLEPLLVAGGEQVFDDVLAAEVDARIGVGAYNLAGGHLEE